MLDRDHQKSLRRAYASPPDCPFPEVFLQASFDTLPQAERQRLTEHASTCPRCAAEQTLAREFDAAADDDANARADVDFIVARLVNPARGGGAALAEVRRFPARRAAWFRWNPALAAAAVFALLMVGSVAIWRTTPPPLPELPGDAITRGSRLELVAPVGEIPTLPESLEWGAVPEADRYRVQLFDVDRSVLLDRTTDGTMMELPPDVAGKMSAAVVYEWEVEALDATGKRLAWSKAETFRVKPPAEE